VTIKHAAVLVILVTVAGTPVSTLVCVRGCYPNAVPASGACHHEMEAASAVGVKDADDTCARLLAVSPFVKEEIQLNARAAVPASAPHVSVHGAPAAEAHLASVRDVVFTGQHRSISALVLRL
jgi:hypothetical protein